MNEFNNPGIILNKGQGVWSRSRERGCGVFFEGSTWFSEQCGDQLLPTEYKWETIENLLSTRGNHKNITELYVGIR